MVKNVNVTEHNELIVKCEDGSTHTCPLTNEAMRKLLAYHKMEICEKEMQRESNLQMNYGEEMHRARKHSTFNKTVAGLTTAGFAGGAIAMATGLVASTPIGSAALLCGWVAISATGLVKADRYDKKRDNIKRKIKESQKRFESLGDKRDEYRDQYYRESIDIKDSEVINTQSESQRFGLETYLRSSIKDAYLFIREEVMSLMNQQPTDQVEETKKPFIKY